MEKNNSNVLKEVPKKVVSTFTVKVVAKDYIKSDGTTSLYIQVFINKERKRIPLDISVKPKMFDVVKQKVKGNSDYAKDCNLIIGKKLAEINKIAVSFRLSDTELTMSKLLKELTNPTPKTDFLMFFKNELENQKLILKESTFKQQKSTYNKLKLFRQKIFFQEIDEDFILKFKSFCKSRLNNQDVTIQTALKNLKKYIHLANKKNIKTPLLFSDIKVKKQKNSNRVFLSENEVRTLYDYRNNNFTNEDHKNILDRFLFSCFTGLRISDIQKLNSNNFIDDFLIFQASKTDKFQKIKLGKSAKEFVHFGASTFKGEYTDQFINSHLKIIAKNCNIQKHLTFHVARHTFATNYLIKGGRVENLQKLLAHSSITETMIYVHIVDNLLNDEIINLDSILH